MGPKVTLFQCNLNGKGTGYSTITATSEAPRLPLVNGDVTRRWLSSALLYQKVLQNDAFGVSYAMAEVNTFRWPL